MCGIFGLISLRDKKIHTQHLRESNNFLSHRGKDGEGYWTEGAIGLAHKRLAIIDLSKKASQPMFSENQRYVISYNGEIYNFKELRSQLETTGIVFKSTSDTEVVINAFQYWGENAFIKFNGMFAISIWDRREKELILARDRYGIKPLYYSIIDSFFLFGSEAKSIFFNENFKKKINYSSIYEYFTFQNLLSNNTFFKNISLLPQGSIGKFNLKNHNLDIKRYWDFDFCKNINEYKKHSYKDRIENLSFLFENSVKRQLIGDVEVGSYLSGGVDSSSITYVASKNTKNLKTFTCGFNMNETSNHEKNFDERSKAKEISNYLKTSHYETEIGFHDMEKCMNNLIWHLEDPRVGQSYPNYYASKLSSKHVKVVLSGTGGDELFAGYPWRYLRNYSSKNDNEKFIDKYYQYWQRLVDNKDLKKMFNPIRNEVKDIWTKDIFKSIFNKSNYEINSNHDFINQSLYFEAKTFLHGLLIVEDKLSMAHGLETRLPFLDNEIVDFAMECPLEFKLNNLSEIKRIDENILVNKSNFYYEKFSDGKIILKDMLMNFFPQDLLNIHKQGFSAPDASWFRKQSMTYVKEKIFNKKSSIYDYIDFNIVKKIVSEHFEGSRNRRLFIWSLLCFESWLNNFY